MPEFYIILVYNLTCYNFLKKLGFLVFPQNQQRAFTYKGEQDNHFNNMLTYIQEYCPLTSVKRNTNN